jgi:hypothetical protein
MDETAATGAGWDFFDRVYCITMAHRRDRQRTARRQFRKVGLGPRVEFVVGSKHPEDVEQGIYDSHRRCLEKGLAQGARNILIFEDDILFEGFRPEILADAVAFMEGPVRWDILFLGCLARGLKPTGHPFVRQIRYRCLAHAYAIQAAFARQLLQRPWRNIPYDNDLARLGGAYFGICPAFAFQSDATTDNTGHLGLERFRNLLGGLRRIQRANEFYQCHRLGIIVLHLALAALGLMIFTR